MRFAIARRGGQVRRGREDRRIAHRRRTRSSFPRSTAEAFATTPGGSRSGGMSATRRGWIARSTGSRRTVIIRISCSSRRRSTSFARGTVRQICRRASIGRQWCRSAAARSRCTMASAATGTCRPSRSRRRARRTSALRRGGACVLKSQPSVGEPTMKTVCTCASFSQRRPSRVAARAGRDAPVHPDSRSTTPTRSRIRRRCAIKPGDRVVTKTIDAGGVDWNGKTVASGGNPETGPFFIEGAEPGDMIVVSIEKLETNRAIGVFQQPAGALYRRSGAIAARVDRDPKRTTWTIDKARGVGAASIRPTCSRAASSCRCKPMLGCIGVAPARKEAIATGVRRAPSAATWTTRRWAPA